MHINIIQLKENLEREIESLRDKKQFPGSTIHMHRSIDGITYSLEYDNYQYTKQGSHDAGIVDVVVLYEDLSISLNIKLELKKSNSKKDKSDSVDDILSVSIHFFKGDDLITRAEWDNPNKVKSKKNHPQPHWHLPEPEKDNLNFDSKEEGDKDPSFPEKGGKENQTKRTAISVDALHLAMAANWHSTNPQHSITERMTQLSLQNWIVNCLKGFLEEYKFQKNKTAQQ